MSIEPEEIIKRQQERIARLESALRLIKSTAYRSRWEPLEGDTVWNICAKALEEKG